MARKREIKIARLFLILLSITLASPLEAIGKLPFRSQWVSVVKRGKLFKYKRKEFSSPRVNGDLIFVGADAGYLYAMKKKTGRKVWRFKADGSVNSAPGFSGDGEEIYFGDDEGTFYALSRKKGRLLWKLDLGSEILTEPAVGDRLFVSTVEGRVVALSADEGRLLWEKEYPFQGMVMTIRGNSPPVLDPDGKRLYLGFSDGMIRALATDSGKLIWEKSLGIGMKGFKDIDGAPLVSGERLFVSLFEGGIFCLNKKSGQVLWSQATGSGVRSLAEGGILYVSGSDGHLYALDEKDGSKIWDTKIGSGALTSPVIHKKVVAVGLSDKTVNFVRAEDGKILARRFAKKGVFSDPVLDGDRIYYLSNGGRLYSLKFVD